MTGDLGRSNSLKYDFGNDVKLSRGRYRLAFRARGTPGQSVEFELADDWRGVSKETRFTIQETWRDHNLDFEIKSEFKDSTVLRFSLPKDAKDTFDLAGTRLKKLN